MTSILKGRWCSDCNGRGSKPGKNIGRLAGRAEVECPSCHWVGFVGLTSAQVRQAEIDCMKEPS